MFSDGCIFSDFLFCVVFCVSYVIVCYMYLSIWAAYLGQDTPEKEMQSQRVSFLVNKGYNNIIIIIINNNETPLFLRV